MLNYFMVLLGIAFAQQFEVASIRPVAQGETRIDIGMHVDRSQVRFNFLSVRDCMRIAYEVRNFQVIGPEWVATDHFNITGKLPVGIGQDRVREMLQNLLADRFQMTIHREKRDFSVYALMTGKGGLKLPESAADVGSGEGEKTKAALDVKATASSAGVYVDLGNGAWFTFAENKLILHKLPMGRMADLLGTFMDKPVVDMTSLDGSKNYDMSLEVTAEDYRTIQIRSALKSGITLPPEAAQMAELPTESLTAAIEATGLRVEARRAPVEVIVIDRVARTPTEN